MQVRQPVTNISADGSTYMCGSNKWNRERSIILNLLTWRTVNLAIIGQKYVSIVEFAENCKLCYLFVIEICF